MKFNFTIDLDECENGYDLESQIIGAAASEIVNRSAYWACKTSGDTLEEKITKRIENMLDEMVTQDAKKKVIDAAISNLNTRLIDKIEKAKIYREAASDLPIDSDVAMKTGIKDMVSDLVKAELRRTFNQK